MATYTTITNTQVEPKAPVTSELMTALRDNPTAIAEGATDAPVAETGWHPYDKVLVGDAFDGEIYSNATDGDVASIISPAFATGYEYMLLFDGIGHDNAGASELRIDGNFSSSGYERLYDESIPLGNTVDGNFILHNPKYSIGAHGWISMFYISGTGAAGETGAGGTGAAQTVGNFRVIFSAGDIDKGNLYMLKRREYTSG